MKTWIETLKEAKAQYALGASSFAVSCILDEARDLYKEEKEEKEKEKKKKTTFEEIGTKIGRLVAAKNAKYGNSFKESQGIIDILYPNGISLDQYSDMLAMIRIIDKLFRIATNPEDDEDPWRDIAGYAILKANEAENENP